MQLRSISLGRIVPRAVLFTALALSGSAGLHAQTCNDWKSVVGWQGTYTLSSNGSFVHNTINMFSISESTGATVSMPTMTDGLCNQLRWQGADLHNTGSVNDSTQVLNACMQGQWFTTDTLVGNTGLPSNSELVVDATDGTFSFQPIPGDSALHTIYNCSGQQSQQIQWGTGPASNWPLNFPLPSQVGPLTVTNYGFNAKNHYAGYQDIAWTWTFNLTPILAGYKNLTVTVQGNGTATSTDGVINCPGICSHYYAPNTQVTLNATPGQGFTFVGWSGACTGTGPCTVTMSQDLTVNAVFSQPLQFVASPPCRVIDTRNPNGPFGGPPLQGGGQRSFPVPQSNCGIPSAAQAYSLNITVVPNGGLGYLTVWPTGENQPLVSTMNSPDGRIKANAAIVPGGTGGAISFYVTNTTNLVVDIDGYFTAAGNGTSQFFALPPCRVIDTRGPNGPLAGPFLNGGVQRDFPVQNSPCLPQGAVVKAYSFNFTAVPHPSGQPLSYLTVWPQGQNQPLVSTLNNPTATIVANAAIVPSGSGGGMSVFPSQDTDLVVDINGYFAAPAGTGLSLYPVPPCRTFDSRSNHGQPFSGERTVNIVGSPCATAATAQAYVFNATVVPSGSLGYLTLWPDGQVRPVASTLNAIDGFIASNMAIVPTSNGSVDAYASGLTHLVLDISGYFAP